MKMKICNLLIVILLVVSQAILAQDVPVPPGISDETIFEFDFQNFPGMSEEDEKELLKNLQKELQIELEVIKNVNKNKYFNFLRESQYKNMKLPFMVKREKAIYERERKIFEAEVKTEALAVKYEQVKESEKTKIKKDLRRELNNLFNQKEERRREEVEQLEKELRELKKSLSARQKNKKDIIERRLQELLDEDQYLEWD